MKFWIALLVSVSTTSTMAGPLGLDMGMPYDSLNKSMKLKQVKPFLYSTPSLPKGHSDFDDYRLLITPKHGLCKVIAWSKAIQTSVYGEGLRDKFEKIESAISQKYGQGKKYDFLRSGTRIRLTELLGGCLSGGNDERHFLWDMRVPRKRARCAR